MMREKCFAILLSTVWSTMSLAAAPAQPYAFGFYHEFFGPQGYSDPQVVQNLSLGIMNGFEFSPPVESGVANVTSAYRPGLMLRLAGAASPASMSDDAIAHQKNAFAMLASGSTGSSFLWNLLPEWDQSGGPWVPQGRPTYRGLSRTAAHGRFLQFYGSTYPNLSTYLHEPPASRTYQLAAVTDYTPNVFDAYELGVDLQFLERGNDELGDPSTGIAFLRGAARQYGRAWGVDLSSWRGGNGRATTYSPSGMLQGGWSASYLRRLYYMAYMSGAQVIQNEAATYRYSDGRFNPFGAVTQEFADFALRRHPDLGHPANTVAVLINPDTGFDPKHGQYNQNDAVWYQDIPYSAGDSMMNQFFRLAYPNHWLTGLAPGAAFANSVGVPDLKQFQNYLAAGLDPRPYEPLPFTRWGDPMDVITTRASDEALEQYKVILLLGDVTLDARLRSSLAVWINRGGVLLMNASQASTGDQALLGVKLDSVIKSSTSSKWTGSAATQTESRYDYSLVHPSSAEVWAVSGSADPLITSNGLGNGMVLLTTPAYLQPSNRDGILAIGIQLLDWLFQRNAVAQVSGPPIAYSINRLRDKLVVALFNHTAAEWAGVISSRSSRRPTQVLEYLSDKPLKFRFSDREASVPVQVPPFDVQIVALEYSGPSYLESRKRSPKNVSQLFKKK